MALHFKGFVLGIGSSLGKCRVNSHKLQTIFVSGRTQVAYLSSTHGEVRKDRPRPWPYETKRYTVFSQFFDHTTKRFDENTKLIIIDGNVAVGKAEFGRKIAKEFDMKFIPDITDERIFVTPGGFDNRSLDEQLPVGARPCDLKTFYEGKVPKKQLMKIGVTQLNMYVERVLHYACALEHLLNTGQGAVLVRSPWSDCVFADAMRRHGFFTPQGHAYYNQLKKNSICEMWKPHVVIYLDAPTSYIVDQLKKRNRPWEVESSVLDGFLPTISNVYKENVLPHMRRFSEVVEYDVTDMPDWEIIVEDLERMDLDVTPEDNDEKFEDWQKDREDDWNFYRGCLANKRQVVNLFSSPLPWNCPELLMEGDDLTQYTRIVREHPENLYHPEYTSSKVENLFKL